MFCGKVCQVGIRLVLFGLKGLENWNRLTSEFLVIKRNFWRSKLKKYVENVKFELRVFSSKTLLNGVHKKSS